MKLDHSVVSCCALGYCKIVQVYDAKLGIFWPGKSNIYHTICR